jgi:hypothetical protein
MALLDIGSYILSKYRPFHPLPLPLHLSYTVYFIPRNFIGSCNVALDYGGYCHDQENYHGRYNFRAMLERSGREGRAW